MIVFDKEKFQKFSRLAKKKDLQQLLKMSSATVKSRIDYPNDLRIGELVAVCNSIGMDPRDFFTEED